MIAGHDGGVSVFVVRRLFTLLKITARNVANYYVLATNNCYKTADCEGFR